MYQTKEISTKAMLAAGFGALMCSAITVSLGALMFVILGVTA